MSRKDHPGGSGFDFGDDADVDLPHDPRFDAWISRVAPDINAPGEAPRAEMWDAVSARVAAQSNAGVRILPIRRARWIWPTAMAAALLLGIGIDRFVLQREPSADTSMTSAVNAPEPADPARLYRLAAVQTLSRAEALLTAFRTSDITTHDPVRAQQLGVFGRQVLGSTRLLLDSPAGDDPRLKSLLNDLELVLVQIIRASGAPLDAGERALIDRAMKDHDLLPRIRTAVPAGASSAAAD